jgi:hypothetical protein
MRTLLSLYRRPALLRCAIVCAALTSLHAGLIIDVDAAREGIRVNKLSIAGGNLAVETTDGSATIKLPRNALPLLAMWARRHSSGPLVFSGEINRMSSESSRYSPPSAPPQIVDAMFRL